MANRYNQGEHVAAIPGEWWIAGNASDQPLPGALQRDEGRGGWRLDIFGALIEPASLHLDHANPTPTLHGFTSDGAVTALDAFLVDWRHTTRQSLKSEPYEWVTQTWQINELIDGGHFYSDQLWSNISFTLPRFSEMFSGKRFPDSGEISSDESSPAIVDGARIVAWRSSAPSLSRSSTETTWKGGYEISHPDGFTLKTADRWIRALQNLHDILFGGHGTPPGYELTPIDCIDESFLARRMIRPFTNYATADALFPFFILDDIEFEHFIPNWISLHTSAPQWPTFGPAPGSSSYLEHQFLQAAHRVEATSRLLFDSDTSTPEDEQEILEKIKSSLNIRQRRRVQHGLKVTRQSLSRSLKSVAEYAHEILPTPAVTEVPRWAEAVSDARNTLAHGLAPKERASIDPHLLIALELSLGVVQKLAMLRAAGYTYSPRENTQPGIPSGFDPISMRQSNSDLGGDIRASRSLSPQWTKIYP